MCISLLNSDHNGSYVISRVAIHSLLDNTLRATFCISLYAHPSNKLNLYLLNLLFHDLSDLFIAQHIKNTIAGEDNKLLFAC